MKRHLPPKLPFAGQSSVSSRQFHTLYSIEQMCHFHAGFYQLLSVSSNMSSPFWRQAILTFISECSYEYYPVFLSWTGGGLSTACECVGKWRRREYQFISFHSLAFSFVQRPTFQGLTADALFQQKGRSCQDARASCCQTCLEVEAWRYSNLQKSPWVRLL